MVRDYQVITVGESTIDAYMTLPHTGDAIDYSAEKGILSFTHGNKIDVERYDFTIGGNATNVAVGLNRLGIKSTLCSETGDDEFSIKIRNLLASEHVERLFVNQVHGASNFSVIMNYKGERTVFVQNVEREHDFRLEDVSTDMVYLTSLGNKWEEPYRKIVDFATAQKACLVFNPGSRQIHTGRDTVHHVMKHTDILILNKEEGENLVHGKEISDSPDNREYLVELMEKLQKLGPKIIVLTNGRHGSYAFDEKREVYFREMFPGEVVERTGAGDAFSAGFLAGAIHGEPLPNSMLWGSINAASVVAHIGAQAGLLRKDELKELL